MDNARLAAFSSREVEILDPSSTYFDPAVDPARFAAGTVIYPGCRFLGASTSVGPNCVLGEEGPLSLRDCQLGANVHLRGGSYDRATILDGADGGVDAHVRPGTLIEEEVVFAHCIGLKQTILLPFVTLGSLANFCDCLMAGGTSRKNHSEVGSSYIHFNFTPHGDKATASLIGDVPRGVLLDQHPIFLGGQGGLVGPSRIAFGTVLPAGQICRADILDEDRMVVPPQIEERVRPYDMRVYGRIDRTVANCLAYIGNLFALDAWYRIARAPRLGAMPHGAACLEGALARIDECLRERVKWISRFREKIEVSVEALAAPSVASISSNAAEALKSQRRFLAAAPAIEEELAGRLATRAEIRAPESVSYALVNLLNAPGSHVEAVRALSAEDRVAISSWLNTIAAIVYNR